MMTIEEKAKAYDEALERAKQIRNGNPSSGTAIVVCEQIFPELAESEDEKIRRTLVEYFGPEVQLDFVRGVPIQKIRDWLEKQKEPKPVEWSEEEERVIINACDFLVNYENSLRNGGNHGKADKVINAAKNLKSLYPQPHWKPSEEQMAVLLNAEGLMRANYYKENAKILAEVIEELKKL